MPCCFECRELMKTLVSCSGKQKSKNCLLQERYCSQPSPLKASSVLQTSIVSAETWWQVGFVFIDLQGFEEVCYMLKQASFQARRELCCLTKTWTNSASAAQWHVIPFPHMHNDSRGDKMKMNNDKTVRCEVKSSISAKEKALDLYFLSGSIGGFTSADPFKSQGSWESGSAVDL